MAGPYLRSGERIILTTCRVSADGVVYDLMLTTDRIFCIDSLSPRFEPKAMELAGILSVRGGTTPAREPAILLLFRREGEGEAQEPASLIFLQERTEDRFGERDEWVKNLIRLCVPREEPVVPPEAAPPADIAGEVGLRPTARHGVAPERVRPLSSVGIRKAAGAPVTVIPDETPPPEEIPPADERGGRQVPRIEVPEEPVPDLTVVRGTARHPPSPQRVIIPQIIEELLPADKRAVLREEKEGERAPAAVPDLRAAIPPILPVPEPQAVPEGEPAPPEPEPAPAITPPEEVPEEPAIFEEPAARLDVPEIIRALRIGPPEPDETPAITAAEPVSGPVPEPETAAVPAPGPVAGTVPDQAPEPEPVPVPEPQVPAEAQYEAPAPAVPAIPVPEPAGHTAADTGEHPPIAAADDRLLRHPVPPAREIRSFPRWLLYAGGLILCIVIAGGAILLLPQGTGTGGPAPVPPAVPAVTAAATQATPSPVAATPTPAKTPVPAGTATTRPVATAHALTIPQNGVWVRVNSTGQYGGGIGNAGTLKPVSGTGSAFYAIKDSNGLVEADVQRMEYTGGNLSVEVYRNGTLIASRFVTAPMGKVSLLIDPATARPPGLTEADLVAEQAVAPAGVEPV